MAWNRQLGAVGGQLAGLPAAPLGRPLYGGPTALRFANPERSGGLPVRAKRRMARRANPVLKDVGCIEHSHL